jgi:exodeoxyribonuclease VII large subunit
MEQDNLFKTSAHEIFTVSRLTSEIKDILEGEFFDIWVEGEISNLRSPSSGHTYMTLKDDSAQLRGVIWKSTMRNIRFQPEDGMLVVARGRVTVYDPRGEYQLIIEHLEPKGVGALQLAFEQLKQRLMDEGLFDPEHKKPLPLLPQTIGVVTSPTGAAIKDILRVLNRRFANVHVLLYPARVQGDEAAAEIAAAIDALNRLPQLCPGQPEIDVIIVGRGGGSLEDLWAFNQEEVARAIYASSIPVISAVGHEIDVTISDMVADVRAPTPSAAAEIVVMNKEEISQRVKDLGTRLVNRLRAGLKLYEERLEGIYRRRPFSMPRERTSRFQQQVDDLYMQLCRESMLRVRTTEEGFNGLRQSLYLLSPINLVKRYEDHLVTGEKRLVNSMKSFVEHMSHNYRELAGRMHSLSPLAVLERGYSICYRLQGREVVKDASVPEIGERLRLRFSRGSALCRMEDRISEGEENGGT